MIETSNKGKLGILVKLFPTERGLEPKDAILVRATSASFIVVVSDSQLAQFKRTSGKANPLKSKAFKGYYVDTELIEKSISIVVEAPDFDAHFTTQSEDSSVPYSSFYKSIKDWALAMGMELYDSEKLRNEIATEG